MKHFSKSSTTIEEQISLLRSRGMIIKDEAEACRWLRTVSYYRLGAYWLDFEITPEKDKVRSKKFREGVSFSQITDIYILDRRLRLLVMEAIDRIEIATRTQWTYEMANRLGPHAHLKHSNFTDKSKHYQNLSQIMEQLSYSQELFIRHYMKKYDHPVTPPLWMITEIMTFGQLSKWIGLTRDAGLLKAVATSLGIPASRTLSGTLQHLNYIRNRCAHHHRLWNHRAVTGLPNINAYKHQFVQNGQKLDKRLYNSLVIIVIMLEAQSPETTYRKRLKELLEEFGEARLGAMGFPPDWRERVLGL